MFDKHNSFMEFYGDVCDNPNDPVERKLAVWQKRNIAFGGKGSAPDPNPGMVASAEAAKTTAEAQKQIAKDTLDFYKQQYQEFKPVLQQVLTGQVETQAEASRQAKEYEQYMKETFRPLEEKLAAEAQAYDTEAGREQLARRAVGDIGSSFGQMRAQGTRQARASGLSTGSGRFAALNQQLNLQEALARAAAATGAREGAVEKARALKYDAAALGRNLPTNITGSQGVSLAAAGGAQQGAMVPGQVMAPGFQGAMQGYQGATQAYGTAGNIYGQEFAGRMQGYQAQQEGVGGLFKGIGGLAGMAFGAPGVTGVSAAGRLFSADGGHAGANARKRGLVSGPGGPVDDMIPAMLSDGEYVLPADTVKAIGKKKLDKVVKKTHTPAAIQRKRGMSKGKK